MSPNLKALTLNPLNIVSIMNDKPTPRTDDRAAAMAWIKERGLGDPEFSKISFATNSGEPKTMCTLKCVGEFEGIPFEIEANYTRDGLPTTNCKVVASTNYSVVCEL